MPIDSSNQGPYLYAQWAQDWKPGLGPASSDTRRKGWGQVMVFPGSVTKLPIPFPQSTYGAGDVNGATYVRAFDGGGGSMDTGGPGDGTGDSAPNSGPGSTSPPVDPPGGPPGPPPPPPPPPVYGCTNPDANNYDPAATADDGSCTFDPSPPGPTPPPYSVSDPVATDEPLCLECAYTGGAFPQNLTEDCDTDTCEDYCGSGAGCRCPAGIFASGYLGLLCGCKTLGYEEGVLNGRPTCACQKICCYIVLDTGQSGIAPFLAYQTVVSPTCSLPP